MNKTNKKSINSGNLQDKALNFALKLFILFLIFGLVVGGYLDFIHYFDNKILPRVSISSQDVGKKTSVEAEKIIAEEMDRINNQGFELVYADNKFNPKLLDLGITIETKDIVSKALAFGREGSINKRTKETYQLITGGYTTPIIVSINQSKVNEFIDTIAPKIEVEILDQKTLESNDEVVDEGRDGLSIDKVKLVDEINNKLNSGQITGIITIPTIVLPRGKQIVKNVFTPGDYYGRYIDVSLPDQKMTLFDNNKIVNEYTVSTGKWATPTPVGTRYIQNKNARAWSPKYGLYMPYWSSIGNGYGIHELPEWPSGYKEGENHLGTPVSHGCIRLGVGPAEFLYNWAPIGTPVYIHK